jgi:heat shock protein HslJ
MDDDELDPEQALTRPDGWQVSSLDAGEVGDVGESAPTLVLDPGGTVSGSTGVNRFRGTYELAEGFLELGPLVTTRMTGTPEAMEVERLFLAVLAEPLAVRWDYATLVLESDTGQLRLEHASGELGVDDDAIEDDDPT